MFVFITLNILTALMIVLLTGLVFAHLDFRRSETVMAAFIAPMFITTFYLTAIVSMTRGLHTFTDALPVQTAKVILAVTVMTSLLIGVAGGLVARKRKIDQINLKGE